MIDELETPDVTDNVSIPLPPVIVEVVTLAARNLLVPSPRVKLVLVARFRAIVSLPAPAVTVLDCKLTPTLI